MASDIQGALAPPVLPAQGIAESPRSAVCWAAILAGSFVAAATSLILFSLGSGLGLAVPSPSSGPSVAAFTVTVGIWLIVTQWAASGVGGYMTGRLRTRWANLHTHEVFFRDTAHGFLTWSVSTVIVALLVAGAASHAAGSAGRTAADGSGAYAYDVDALLRSPKPDDSPSAPAARAEAARILTVAAATGSASADDRDYLARMVATRTGVSAADAQTRVDAAMADVEKARRSASATSIFTALAMLVGAFIACVAAALGGKLRDEHL